MLTTSYFFLFMSTLAAFTTIFYVLYVSKELNYLNPFFILLSFILLYLTLPSFSAVDIRHYFNWSFMDENIFYSNVLIALVVLFFSFMLFLFRKIKLNKHPINISNVIKVIWLTIVLYLLFILFTKFIEGSLFFNTHYQGTTDPYKLKNIAYLLVTVSILYYSSSRKLFVFLPNILIAFLDILDGSRTTALIALVPVFLSLSIYHSKTYIVPVFIGILGLSIIGILRNDTDVVQNVPPYLNAIGEVRETYVTLPIFVTDDNFVGRGDLATFLASVTFPLLHPLRNEILNSFTFPGIYAASIIDRGYGLGANFLMDSIYYGYFFIFFTLTFMLFLCLMVYKLVQRTSLVYALIIMSYFIVFSRLSIREGVFINFSTMIFVILIYMLPLIVLNYFFNLLKKQSHSLRKTKIESF